MELEIREAAHAVDDELHGDRGDDDTDDSSDRIDAGLSEPLVERLRAAHEEVRDRDDDERHDDEDRAVESTLPGPGD